MKILLITHQFATPFSGVGTYARSLAHGLREEGIESLILCPSNQCAVDEEFQFVRTKNIRAPGSHARWMFASAEFASSIRRAGSCDIIHFLDAREALFLHKTDVPVVGTIHDYYFVHPLNYWKNRLFFPDWPWRTAYAFLVRLLEPRALRSCDHLIANSWATKHEVGAAYGIPDHRISPVYIGLDLMKTQGAEFYRSKERAVLFVGGNPYRKGLPRLLRAVEAINRETAVELWIAGTALTPALKRMALSLKLEDRISVYPHLNALDLANLYSRASCLALPGLTEAFGLVFLEAFAHGCPVIGPINGGTSEIIEDGKNGYLVESDEDEDLTRKLIRLLDDDELRKRFVMEGRKTLESYTVKRMVRETVSIYEMILSGNR